MKTLLLALTMLCCTAWVAAQTGPSGSGNTSPDQTSPSSQTSPSDQTGSQTDSGSSQTAAGSSQGMGNSNESTIQGCLTSSGGNFMLTDASGVQYQLQGDTSKLQSHANQEVQVKGTSSSGSSASGSASGSAGNGSMSGSASNEGMGTQGTGTATTAGTFTVSKVKKISGTCTSSK